MVVLSSIASIMLLVSSTWASPLPSQLPNAPLSFPVPPIIPTSVFCDIPFINVYLCPRSQLLGLTVSTPLGTAQGTADVASVNRYAVRYASANRWEPSTLATTWELPNGSPNASAIPLMCPQPGVDASSFSEDCLSMILYVPNTLTTTSNVPTLMWIHGGSFMIGSATDPGLDGSNLALATNSIVAVVQYRLGALGFISPNGNNNLGLKDSVNALQFLSKVLPSFGGHNSKITVAGQSSGANMIRALLAVPSASSLFQNAILQSDPMDYGFLSIANQNQLQDYFIPLLNCSSTDTSCLDGLSAYNIVNDAGITFFNNAYTVVPAATQSEPMRVVNDGTFITSTLDSTTTFPRVAKPILLSNVVNEAGYTIYGNFPAPVPEDTYNFLVNATYGTQRTNVLIESQTYVSTAEEKTTTDFRPQLEALGTDSIWRCATWTFARNWVQNGGDAYVGMYAVGASYPGNSAVSFCTEPGVVCHQDDIEIVFGTVPNPDSAQSVLITEMQARYKSFMNTGNPNPEGSSYPNWEVASTSDVNAIYLGASGPAPVGACTPSFWGAQVPYDYQVYDI